MASDIGGLADTLGEAPVDGSVFMTLGGGGLNPNGLNSGLVGVDACGGAPGAPGLQLASGTPKA